MKYLLATGDDVLVEASPMDTMRGIGFGRDAPEANVPKMWRGRRRRGA